MMNMSIVYYFVDMMYMFLSDMKGIHGLPYFIAHHIVTMYAILPGYVVVVAVVAVVVVVVVVVFPESCIASIRMRLLHDRRCIDSTPKSHGRAGLWPARVTTAC
jgi:hypothetical protein